LTAAPEANEMHEIHAIDSHTAGEPTRVVLDGGPDLGRGPMAERAKLLRQNHDQFRSAVVNEPRGSDVLVGALVCEPADPTCSLGVIYFNNVGPIGMCGHGTIGLIATLAEIGRIKPGTHRIDTVVGVVSATLQDDGRVSVENVASHRKAKDVAIRVDDLGEIVGDVAWGGNWFYLVSNHGQDLTLGNVETLTRRTWQIRRVINASGFPEIDHIELFGAPANAKAHSRNFVLCPGGAYDRSPCGTGTSAKLACLAADGKLAPEQPWVQESILGTHFEGRYRWADAAETAVVPTITGAAYVTAELRLKFDERDPFRWGIRNL
jgi:4-hydroxyproline epimerase